MTQKKMINADFIRNKFLVISIQKQAVVISQKFIK